MSILLQIDSSPLSASVSRELTREFAAAWVAAHPGSEVIRRDLARHPPPPIDALWIGGAHTPADQWTPEQAETLAVSEELIRELEQADEYVIGVAMHNFSIPSVLKLWVDQVVRAGRTFSYGDGGPKGLLLGKKATVLVASGGVYEGGTPAGAMNHIEPYLKMILGFVGVTDVTFIAAGGTAALRSADVNRSAFLAPVVERVRAAAV